jgi:hypothetical protein
VRPILGTFFRLAALTRDASLVRSCVRLASVGFWQFDLGDDVARRQAQLLAVEYLAAAAYQAIHCGRGWSWNFRPISRFHSGNLCYFPRQFCASFAWMQARSGRLSLVAALSAPTGPLRAVGPDARARRSRGPRNTDDIRY